MTASVDDQLAVIRRALDAVEAGDVDGYLACLADDVVVDLPYAESGIKLDKAGIGRMIGFLVKTFATRSFGIEQVYVADDGPSLAIEYHSLMRSRIGDVDYANCYVGVFEFRDGLVTLWREYANPVAFDRAMEAIKMATA